MGQPTLEGDLPQGVRRAGTVVAATALGGYTALVLLGRGGGATRAERRASLPGDGVVPRPHMATDHSITIDAPPDRVWPWLTQLGWHLGGYYTPEWVDRYLFPDNLPSLGHLDPALVRTLEVGDTIPDGPPGTAWYVVDEVDAPHVLVLHSTTHIPPGWAERFPLSRHRATEAAITNQRCPAPEPACHRPGKPSWSPH